ncbi:hypothetical protein [Deinococcus yavapaiensis]|uniref:Uncharacterized protein n=1 Tax=Deinococcus yavapaiensis KR-236 TaxID=694435 RepID=A0A318S817_9DEIO|nr:hypothetical protein [Deinococcus yavapaiensis]PYE53176.1 hypothetical protein DES52_110160 [Deinococcus yavapaiensis KR-236]
MSTNSVRLLSFGMFLSFLASGTMPSPFNTPMLAQATPPALSSTLNAQQVLRNLQSTITSRGVVGNAVLKNNKAALSGPRRFIAASQTIAWRTSKSGQPKPQSSMASYGINNAPPGFAEEVTWSPADAGLAVIVFVNPRDPNGILITGVKKGDTIDVVSSTGLASFDEDTENEYASGIISIAAAGAGITAAAFGAPELAPFISAAEKFAKDVFKPEKVKSKRRDPFGYDPGTGERARAEGGVLISMPAAGQTFYSGDSDHKERWIKDHQPRTDRNLPDHISNAFFLREGREYNSRTSTMDGDIIINAWDHKFEDNYGYYRLHILLKRGGSS